MKAIIISLTALALCAQSQAEDRSLSTADGVTYTAITLQRVEPDGLYIEYTAAGGGMGLSKVKFNRLSRAQQKQFGYDKTKAHDYEVAVAQANQDAAQELTHRYEVERDARRQRDAENERAYPARMAEITRINADLAADFYRDTHAGPEPTSSLSYGTQFTANRPTSQTFYTPVSSADIFPSRGVTKTH